MPLNWPANTATPPLRWEALIDVDGSRPMGWFTTTGGGGMRAVVRGYPAWDDTPFYLPPDARVHSCDPDDPYHYLHDTFDIAYRGYAFPDVGHAGPATHSFVNLDFCGGWQAAIGYGTRAHAAALGRTLAGFKPAADLLVELDHVVEWTAAAHAAGLDAMQFGTRTPTRLWVSPERLADRVDRDALTSVWHALADADPTHRRGDYVRAVADTGLDRAFSLDLLAPPVQRGGRLVQPWWDEDTDEGLVVLGAVLGYPPASTYSVIVESEEDVLRSLVDHLRHAGPGSP